MNNHPLEKILLVTTEGTDTEGAQQTALQIAKRSAAKVIIADSIRTPFHLPKTLRPSASRIYEIATKVKQDYLDKVADPFRTAGVEVDTKLLMGTRSSEDITKLAIAEDCDLVVRYFKGEHSQLPGRFGYTAKSLMRTCPCPLLFVEEQIPDDPKILACISAESGVPENQSILNAAADISRTNVGMHALCCWLFESALHLCDDPDTAADTPSHDQVQAVLAEIRNELEETYDLSNFEHRIHVEKGDPTKVIPSFCSQHAFDIAIMSSASLNHPLNRLLGSTIEKTIDKLPCSLLVTKPVGFVSPVEVKTENSQADSQFGFQFDFQNDELNSDQKGTQTKAEVIVFDDLTAAQSAVQSLYEAGFDLDKIELITKGVEVGAGGFETPKDPETTNSAMIENVTKWGSVGAAAGSLSVVFTPFPGLVLGSIAVAGLTGAIMGGMAGVEHAAEDDSVDLPSIQQYQRLVRRGKFLVVVRGTHTELLRVESIIKKTHDVQSHIFTLGGHRYHEHPARG